MKSFSLPRRVLTLFEHLRHADPAVSKLTVKVDNQWAEGKRPSTVEACLGDGVHIDQVIHPASCEVEPRSVDGTIRRGDVLLMHVEQGALQRTEAFLGRNLEA